MKCAYCREEMNEGATVCKTCGRQQPPTAEQQTDTRRKWFLVLLVLVFIVPLVAASAWGGYEKYERHAARDMIVQCAHTRGQGFVTADFIDGEFDELSNGQGWRTGANATAIEYGCRGALQYID
jgi:hypothetical protein